MRGMSINSVCRVSVDTTADEFVHREHVQRAKQDNFREISKRAASVMSFHRWQRGTKEHADPIGGISRIEIGWKVTFLHGEPVNSHAYTKLPTKCVSLLSLAMHHRSALYSFHYLFILPSREVDLVPVHVYIQPGERGVVDLNFGKGLGRPCTSTKDFIPVRLEYLCTSPRIRYGRELQTGQENRANETRTNSKRKICFNVAARSRGVSTEARLPSPR